MTELPKVLYTYWDKPQMSFLRYMTLYSFHKYNPDWSIVVYGPKGNVDFVEYRELPKDWIEHFKEMTPAHTSDLLRIFLLGTCGGVWADSDILFLKPFYIEKEFICFQNGYYSIGLMGAKPNNQYFKWLFELVLCLKDTTYSPDKYQCFGSDFLGKFPPRPCDPFYNLPMRPVYYFDWGHIQKIFSENNTLPDDTLGIHWYGGSDIAKEWEPKITSESYKNINNTICTYIRKVMDV